MTDTYTDPYAEWERLDDELHALRVTTAPLRALYEGGMTSVAEHQRSAFRAAIEQEFKEAAKARNEKLTESAAETLSKADARYGKHLDTMLTDKARMIDADAQILLLESQLARARSRAYDDRQHRGP